MKLGFVTKKRRVIAIIVLVILVLPIKILISDILAEQTDRSFLIIFVLLYISSAVGIYLMGLPRGIVNIDERGVSIEIKKKDICIDWTEIKYIVCSKQFNGKYIGIFGKEFKEKYNENVEYTEDWRLVPVSEFSDEFFYFEFQKEGLDEIKKYWDKAITNEYKVIRREKSS